jgi:hypothetical protein
VYRGWLPAFPGNQPGSKEKQQGEVENVETVGKSGEAMCDGRVWRRILANLILEQCEQEERKSKPKLNIAKKGIQLPNTRDSQTYAREDGKKTQHAECGRS